MVYMRLLELSFRMLLYSLWVFISTIRWITYRTYHPNFRIPLDKSTIQIIFNQQRQQQKHH